MEREVFIWLGLLIVFLVVEIITVGLTSIWLAGGSLAALLFNIAGLSLVWQVIAFFVVSFLLLFFTRPFAVKYINSHHEKTNYEGVIGKIVRVTKTVDNLAQTGTAVVGGEEWTARSETDGDVLEPGTLAKVVRISGVKLILKRYEEE
ncbi:NfeD family protein [Muricomes intestini]|jgi:membrane protein implicated in regulation of membrane protease activity|uniref:Membrane protein implicated in regulation of membrane protease activity n=1 Tax=Muricomes intestini TaxID=1796634 RepID=A0A4R3KIT7_9FIRM|nr:NfeD family protein [Muricomes intestini]TCS82607.1 membrane protein implicated in regulation of membrane protease activity [Muricomes intestini]HAX50701.1 NfeD family protein [Lachnospiraceae bacterium]HCR81846.1 NfeD family protein [Lachnospiraceae bacterium]